MVIQNFFYKFSDVFIKAISGPFDAFGTPYGLSRFDSDTSLPQNGLPAFAVGRVWVPRTFMRIRITMYKRWMTNQLNVCIVGITNNISKNMKSADTHR